MLIFITLQMVRQISEKHNEENIGKVDDYLLNMSMWKNQNGLC